MSNFDDTPKTPVVIIRMHELIQKLRIGRSSIYDKMDPKSTRYDSTFPKPVKLGKAAMGWIESEIDSWVLEQRVL